MTVYKSEESKAILMKRYDTIMRNFPVEYKSTYINTNFGNTHVIEWGTGEEVIILLHGSSSNSSMWISEAEALKNYRVVAIDILGEPGKSEEIRLNLKSDESSKWLLEILDYLELSKVHLIGNSLGGFVALDFATRQNERVKSLILIATSGLAPAKLSFVFKSIFYLSQGDKGIMKLIKLIDPVEVNSEVVEVTKEMMMHFNPRVGSLPVLKAKLHHLSMPVKFIAGKKDQLLNTKKSAIALKKHVPTCEIEILDTGHAIYNIGDLLVKFLNSNL